MNGAITDIIRNATATSHRRLDEAMARLDLSVPLYYESFLRSQAEALFSIEAHLETANIADHIPDWNARARTQALKADLAALHIDCTPLPSPDFPSVAAMFGAVYVLEASRMGERVMLARLAEHPDSDCMNATAYLRHGFGKRLWPSFITLLENHPAPRADTAGVVAGAATAFAMFENTLIPVAAVAKNNFTQPSA